MKNRSFFTLLINLSLVFLFLFSSCQPTGSPTPVAMGGLGLNCEQTEAAISLTKPGSLTAGPFFIDGQVILMGAADSVEQVAEDNSLMRLAGCSFSLPEQLIQTFAGGLEFPLRTSKEAQPFNLPFYDPASGKLTISPDVELVMNLYQYGQDVTLQDIFTQTNQVPEVYADPNYLVGSSAKSACGDPNGLAGKPFEVEGSPFEVEGSPYGGAVISATLQGFWDQWAFDHMHIPNPNDSPPEVTGKGVRIAVFDTSPYKLKQGSTFAPVTEMVTATEISPPLEMTVHHPWELFAIPPSTELTQTVDVRSHGLFVASLVHAAAPDSSIDLYRVLDQLGCGDLFHLNSAMLDFVSSKLGEKDLESALEQPAVMNLSLGVLKPRQPPPDLQIANLTMDQAVSVAYNIIQMQGNSIASLSFMTGLAYQAGIVVVAAAGNDSLPDQTFSMELPAAYSSVIGVSASTVDNLLACYSNSGDVIAPGAESGTGTVSGKQICVPLTESCRVFDDNHGEGACPSGVVGLFKAIDSDQCDFAYWVGTSFATPLISGKAALEYASGSNINQVYNDLVTMFPYSP